MWPAISCSTIRDYLKAERAELLKKPLNFDYIGFGLLALTMSSWEIMLSKGQQWDWLGDAVLARADAADAFVGGLVFLIIREMRISNPVVNFRPLGERNFAACCIIIFCALRRALRSEHVASRPVADVVRIRRLPFGARAVAVGRCGDSRAPRGRRAARPRPRRALVHCGRDCSCSAIASYWMSLMNLQISPWQVVWPRVVTDRRPVDDLCSAERRGLPVHAAASAGGGRRAAWRSCAMKGAASARRSHRRSRSGARQFHKLRLGEYLDPFNPAVVSFARQSQAAFYPTNRRPGGGETDELASAR